MIADSTSTGTTTRLSEFVVASGVVRAQIVEGAGVSYTIKLLAGYSEDKGNQGEEA
jgi:hypothetical protein